MQRKILYHYADQIKKRIRSSFNIYFYEINLANNSKKLVKSIILNQKSYLNIGIPIKPKSIVLFSYVKKPKCSKSVIEILKTAGVYNIFDHY